MLTLLETMLLHALEAALPGQDIKTGPGAAAPAAGTARVAVCAARLERPALLAAAPPADSTRTRAQLCTLLTLAADAGNGRTATLPDGAAGRVSEICDNNGRMLRPGDHYSVEARKILFLSAPAWPLSVLLANGPARGYADRDNCRGEVGLSVWAADAAAADRLMGSALPALLAALDGRDVLDLTAAAGFRLRLLRPRLDLAAFERSAPAAGVALCHARLVLGGELEIHLGLGAPEPEGTIESIEYAWQTSTPD